MKPETEPQKINGNAPILSRNSESSNGPGRLMIRTGLHHFVLSKAVQHPSVTSLGNDGGAGSKQPAPSEPEIPITSPFFLKGFLSSCQRYLLGSRRSSHPPREMILPLALQLPGCTMKSSPLWPENLSPTSAEMPKSPAVFSFSQELSEIRRCWK